MREREMHYTRLQLIEQSNMTLNVTGSPAKDLVISTLSVDTQPLPQGEQP